MPVIPKHFSSYRYASLYFCCAVDSTDNELLILEVIHRYVELLDKYFGSVCELDIIFNFEKAYFILDEFILGGEVQETSKKNVLKAISAQDVMQEVCLARDDVLPSQFFLICASRNIIVLKNFIQKHLSVEGGGVMTNGQWEEAHILMASN
jgi:Clathrin adaptor complex small chain